MGATPLHFNETVGGYVLLAGVASTILAFGLLRDRSPRFSAISLLALGAGCFFASYWLLATSPGDRLDQLLSRPIGVLTLIGALGCLVWGIRKLRAAAPSPPLALRKGQGRVTRAQPTPLLVWVAAVGAAITFAAVTLIGPFTTGIWHTKHRVCRIPSDLPCTGVLLGFSSAIGFIAGLLVYFACSRLLRWIRSRLQ